MAQQFANAQEAMGYVVDQTYRINAEVYEQEYPDYDYASLVPVDSTGPEWVRGVITYTTGKVGRAAWQSAKAKDVPLADVTRGRTDQVIDMAAIGYGYDLEEINHASMLGMNLSNMKADSARQAYAEFMYNLALFGDTPKGWYGLLNSTAVTSGLVAQNAGATSRLWSAKTHAEIISDINSLLTGIYTGSQTVEMANTILMSPERLAYLAERTIDGTTMTVLQFILANNIYTLTTGQQLTIRAVRNLSTAGASATQRMVAYRRDPKVVKLHLPMPHRFLPAWQDGPLSIQVPGIFRTGGIEILRPGAVRYADGF